MTWRVNRFVKKPYMNIEHIHPLMQDDVERLIESLRMVPFVNKIIIFGSSVRNDCSEWSDLDVMVDTLPERFKKPYLRIAQGIDLLDAVETHLLDESFYNHVMDEGVVVYER